MIKLLNWLIEGSVEYIYQYVSRAQLYKWIILMKEKFLKKKTIIHQKRCIFEIKFWLLKKNEYPD